MKTDKNIIPTKQFRATNTKFKGEFAGPWQILTWDFVNREVWVLPETDDHLEGGEQLAWSYDDVVIEQGLMITEKTPKGGKRLTTKWIKMP